MTSHATRARRTGVQTEVRQESVLDDPISFEIVRGRLVTVADEMQTHVVAVA